MLKRTLFKKELEPNWPGPDKVSWLHVQCSTVAVVNQYLVHVQLWDWDMWMRLNVIRKDRSDTTSSSCACS